MLDNRNEIAAAIKQLRDDLSLSQVQLSNAIGLTPASIYRYEAGTSTPSTEILAAFWNYALVNGSKSVTAFSSILSEVIEPLRQLFEGSAVEGASSGPLEAIRLDSEERILVSAFIKMIRSPMYPALTRFIWAGMEPWINQARTEFAQHAGIEKKTKAKSLAKLAGGAEKKQNPTKTGRKNPSKSAPK